MDFCKDNAALAAITPDILSACYLEVVDASSIIRVYLNDPCFGRGSFDVLMRLHTQISVCKSAPKPQNMDYLTENAFHILDQLPEQKRYNLFELGLFFVLYDAYWNMNSRDITDPVMFPLSLRLFFADGTVGTIAVPRMYDRVSAVCFVQTLRSMSLNTKISFTMDVKAGKYDLVNDDDFAAILDGVERASVYYDNFDKLSMFSLGCSLFLNFSHQVGCLENLAAAEKADQA